jgi:hypothetical protein
MSTVTFSTASFELRDAKSNDSAEKLMCSSRNLPSFEILNYLQPNKQGNKHS